MHISFLETCTLFNIGPRGLQIKRKPLISFQFKDLEAIREDTFSTTTSRLLETLIIGIHDKLSYHERKCWETVINGEEKIGTEEYMRWLVKLAVDLERREGKLAKKKRQKLKKLSTVEDVRERLNNEVEFFTLSSIL